MKVIISAGGTGGHIYPALAIIKCIKKMEPDSSVLYIGTHNRMEKDIVPANNIPFKSIEIYGFSKNLLKNIKTVKCFFSSLNKCKDIIKKFNPDIVIGVGGYVTGPVVYAAQKLGYKTFIHEQNSIPGKSNKFLSRKCNKIGVSFKSTVDLFPPGKAIFTGNPCGENAINIPIASKSDFNLTDGKKLVYIVMGSLGSEKMTEFLIKTIYMFKNKNYEVLFVTGKNSYELVKNNEFPSNVKVVPYIDNQARIMKRADLVVTRCGASTLSEIIGLEKPSILIPSPYVANNHQYKNALDLINRNAAVLLEEKDLEGDILVRKIEELINDNSKLEEMKKNLKELYIPNSSQKIYNILRNIIDEK